MDPALYRCARYGKLNLFPIQYNNQLHQQLTPAEKSNLLHVCAQFHDSAEFLRDVLNMQSSEVERCMHGWQNSIGETALHVASRNGRYNIVQLLIQRMETLDEDDLEGGVKMTKEIMRATDRYGDTVLHKVVGKNRKEVAEFLLRKDPHFEHPMNYSKETPLFLAIDRGYFDVMDSILTICTSPGYKGPSGLTVLHAAVFSNNLECVTKILQKYPNLAKQADNLGWIPLHCAAHCRFTTSGLDVSESMLLLDDKLQQKYRAKMRMAQGVIITMREALKKGWTEKQQRRLEDLRKKAETHLLVAALIATVTFAAGFTLPGGYNGDIGPNQGMAVLIEKAAFKTFVVVDTVAVISSVVAVFLHFTSTSIDDDKKLYGRYSYALLLIIIAMMTMVIAFIMGLYVVLHGSLGLTISVCVLGSFTLLVFSYMIFHDAPLLHGEVSNKIRQIGHRLLFWVPRK